MTNLKQQLGNRIRQFRKKNNLTQEQLAELVDIGTQNISYIETGRFAPSSETLEKLAKIFNVEIYELYIFNDSKPPEEMKKELFNAMNNSNELTTMMYKFYLAVK